MATANGGSLGIDPNAGAKNTLKLENVSSHRSHYEIYC